MGEAIAFAATIPETFVNYAGALTPRLDSGEAMQRFSRFALRFVPGSLVICAVLLAGQCVAQEVEVPRGHGTGAVFAPTGWAELIAPVQDRVDLKFYGFYVGDVKAPSAQLDATVRVTKFLSITPS